MTSERKLCYPYSIWIQFHSTIIIILNLVLQQSEQKIYLLHNMWRSCVSVRFRTIRNSTQILVIKLWYYFYESFKPSNKELLLTENPWCLKEYVEIWGKDSVTQIWLSIQELIKDLVKRTYLHSLCEKTRVKMCLFID
jgi:hypothetical protein